MLDIAVSYNNIGSAYEIKGDYQKAIEFYQKALKLKIKELGEDHADVATTFNNLGLVYDCMGMYD